MTSVIDTNILNEEKEVDVLNKNINWNLLNTKIPFGKHRGTPIVNLEKNYQEWLIKNNIFKNEEYTEQLKLLLYLDKLKSRLSF